jgi:hypothetical protein
MPNSLNAISTIFQKLLVMLQSLSTSTLAVLTCIFPFRATHKL